MIGIIGAMEEEVTEMKALMDIHNQKEYNGYIFYEGEMNHHDVVLVQGGIGKVNAAISATLLIHHYDIDCVLNIGSAGGLSLNQNVGDVVISNQVAHHDVDVTAFGRSIGEIPGQPLYFEPDHDLFIKAQTVFNNLHIPTHVGLIVSGDQFIHQQNQVEKIKENFPNAMCVEMEAAAVAQVCHVFKKKFLITRSLSDIYNKGDNSIQFDEYLKKASVASAKMCYHLIGLL